MKKNYCLLFFLMLLMIFPGFSQTANKYWTKSGRDAISNTSELTRQSNPVSYQIFRLDLNAFKQVLDNAPLTGTVTKSDLIVEFPTAQGEMERYRVVQAPILSEGLSNTFPMIKTYKGVGVDDPTATMRFSVTQLGLHTISLSGKRTAVFIDPYTEDRQYYIIYDKASLSSTNSSFECLTDEGVYLPSLEGKASSNQYLNTDDQTHRTYRLALSCNGEYAQIFAGTGTVAQQKANVQAQMAITMNRVNEIYERDLAITLVFIPNNDAVIYLNPLTDPWNGEFNTTTAQTLDNVIGVANYDIGHNFNTSGGGSAGCIGCVCAATSQTGFHKGRGFTGSSNPTGDPFDIDYVAHEMGHQFGGYHTQSNSACISGSGLTEVEPGSGSSIMGYAGICAPNVQSNSDAHFNYVNIRDILNNVKSGTSSSCDIETAITSQPPVANAGNDYTIPAGTAYVLTGSATDPDGDATLTYNWSQNDPEPTGNTTTPSPTWTDGPMYRSILPTDTPVRYMPKFSDVLSGNLTPTWEVTPSVSRTLNFAFMVRDNGSGFASGYGQTHSDLMQVIVNAAAGPFAVTSQNVTDISWTQGTTETISWNVAGTTGNGINTANVDILLSTDGGATFDTVLASNTPNDGTEDITVPNIAAPFCRLMIKPVDNIYYAVNSETFAIGYTVTTNCTTYSSAQNLGLAIPDGAGGNGNPGPAAVNTINVPDVVSVDYVSVNADVSHGWINDLIIEVIHPDGTTSTNVWNRECGSEDNIDVTFTDGAPAVSCATPTVGTYSPSSPLSVFSGLQSDGDWSISITDNWDAFVGTLNDWSIELCTITTQLSVEEFSQSGQFSLYPNPNNGEFTVSLRTVSENVGIEVFDIRGRAVYTQLFKNVGGVLNQPINLSSVQSGMYLVKVSSGTQTATKKIIIE